MVVAVAAVLEVVAVAIVPVTWKLWLRNRSRVLKACRNIHKLVVHVRQTRNQTVSARVMLQVQGRDQVLGRVDGRVPILTESPNLVPAPAARNPLKFAV